MKSKKIKVKKKSAGINLIPFLIIAGFLGSALTIYISYRASISENKLFPISLIALFTGLIFESLRVSENWKTVLGIFVGTYLFSFLSFLPGKRELHYNFENHIEMWPYSFIFFFTIFFSIFFKDRVTAKLTEGITLLLSLSLVYWAFDYGFINYHNCFSIILIIIGFLLSIFSLINAVTKIQLARTNRLILSIWSTIIMFAFAIDNIIQVFSNHAIENSKYLSEGLYIAIQYFFLGISAIYIMQNYILLVAFLPSKDGNYRSDLKENIKDHIERYSNEQVDIEHSFFCILYAGSIFWLNYNFQILPRHTMIWFVFLTFPWILQLTTYFWRKQNF